MMNKIIAASPVTQSQEAVRQLILKEYPAACCRVFFKNNYHNPATRITSLASVVIAILRHPRCFLSSAPQIPASPCYPTALERSPRGSLGFIENEDIAIKVILKIISYIL